MATKQIEGHEPAFGHGNHEQGGAPGMSLRDWFAGQALTGNLAASRAGYPSDKAHEAYRIADAMLAERSES